jgi:hypothetical protein
MEQDVKVVQGRRNSLQGGASGDGGEVARRGDGKKTLVTIPVEVVLSHRHTADFIHHTRRHSHTRTMPHVKSGCSASGGSMVRSPCVCAETVHLHVLVTATTAGTHLASGWAVVNVREESLLRPLTPTAHYRFRVRVCT